jgi:hypothetical protein
VRRGGPVRFQPSREPSSLSERAQSTPGNQKFDLDIIGELCHFLEIGRIVMALSWKPVILAVPIQAWPAARVS